METKKAISCFIIFMICIIIGLPTFFTGCKSSITNFCPDYNIFNGYIYKTEVKRKTCCTSSGWTSSCVQCWDVYAYASNNKNYNESTNTCYYTVVNGDRDEKYAKKQAKKYYVGKGISWYERKTSNECLKENEIEQLWTTGIVFLSFAGFVLVVWFLTCY